MRRLFGLLRSASSAMNTPWVWITAAVAACCACAAVPRAESPRPIVYVSQDKIETVLAEVDRATYYNSDATRLCFTYSVPGRWRMIGEMSGVSVGNVAMLQAADGRVPATTVGVALFSPRELDGHPGADLPARAAHATRTHYEQKIGEPSTSSLEPVSMHERKVLRWDASWALPERRKLHVYKVFTEIAPGWVAQITAPDEARAREILNTLQTTDKPGCYSDVIKETQPL